MSEGTSIYYSIFWGIPGIFPKTLVGVVTVQMIGSDELATLRANYYAWTSCCHDQRQWVLDLSELLSNYNLYHQQAWTDYLLFYLSCSRMNTILVGKGGE